MDIQPSKFPCGCVISTICGEVEHVSCADPDCMVKTEIRRIVEQMNAIVVPIPSAEAVLAKRYENGGFGMARVPLEWMENPDGRMARLSHIAGKLARELRPGEKVEVEWVKQISSPPDYQNVSDFFVTAK